MTFDINFDALAQVTENGIGLGSIFDKLKVDVDQYKEIIDGFKELDLSKEIFLNKDGKANWDAIAESIKGCDETALSYFKTLDDGNGTINNQSASVEGLSEHLKATGQSFDFAAVKATLLNTALNAGIALIATLALQGVIKLIDNLAHSAEHCKERVDELMSSYDTTISTLNDNAKAISEITDRYDELSKGVGNLGNNISLTEEEFEEYHGITSKIAEMYPDLVEGWDAQGNAIVNLTDSVKELNAEYDKSLHNANLMLMESKEDIFKNYENTVNDIIKDIEYAEKAMDIIHSGGSFYDVLYDNDGAKTSYYKAFENLGLSVDDMVNNNFNTLEKQLTLKIQSLKDEMEKAAQDVTPLLNAYLAEDTDYQNLSDKELKTALSTFINSLPSTLVTDITENGASAGSNFIEGLVDTVKDDEDVQNALKQLLTIDVDGLPYEEAKSIVDNYIAIIVNALNSVEYEIDPIELQVELGLDIPNIREELRTRLSNGTQDLIIDDWVAELTDEEVKFANSTAFDEALERQREKLDGASLSADNYSAALEEVKVQQNGLEMDETPILSQTISQTVDQLNTRLKPTFDSLQSAYQDIFSSDGFNLDAVDIPMLESIKSSIEEINDLEDVDINIDMGAFDKLAATLTDINTTEEQAQQAFNDFATSIFYATDSTVGMADETRELVEQLLESLGVVNASEVAEYALLEAKAQSVLVSHDLANATVEEYSAILDEGVAAGITRQEIYALTAAEIAFGNNDLSVEQKIEKLNNLATAYGDTASAALATAIANDLASGHTDVDSAINDLMAKINAGVQRVDIDFSGLGKASAKSAGKEAGKSFEDGLKEQLSDLDSVISGITGRIDDQISSVNTEKETVLSAIDQEIDAVKEAKEQRIEAIEAERDARLEVIETQRKQIEENIKAKQKIIDGIQDEIDAMRDANEERQREIDLQKAKYELERMQNQRTILQYSEDRGMHYVTDTKDIRSQKQTVEDAKLEIEIADKEKQIDFIEKEIDKLNESLDLLDEQENQVNEHYDQLIKQTEAFYDSQIKVLEKQRKETELYFESITKNLENTKSKFQELTEILEKAELSAKLKQLGIDEEALLNGSEAEFNKLKDAYMNIVTQLNAGNDDVLSSLQELSGYDGTVPSVLSDSNSELDTMNISLDTSSQNIESVNTSLADTSTQTSDVAANIGDLETNLSNVNTLVTDEQTVFDNLKLKIDEVIEAIKQKTLAIQEEQNAVGIAASSEMADFILLKDKILEVKESLGTIDDSVGIIDTTPINNLSNAFQLLYDKLLLVSTVLGAGMKGQEEGAVSGISSAIEALNEISLEEGIIAQFDNLKTAIDSVTSAISGGGGESSDGEGKGSGSGKGSKGESGGKSSGSEGSGNSLTGAITEMGETASEVIGSPDAEGDGTVIGEFGSLKTAVNDAATAIGGGESEGSKGQGEGSGGEGNLIDSIVNLGEQTEEVLDNMK